MNITVISVGKIKEKFFKAAIEEYAKRLSRYCRFEIVEVKDEKTPDNPSVREREMVLNTEGERIISKLPKNARIISLCVEGESVSSEGLADIINDCCINGTGSIVFIIGGSMGLSDSVKKMSDIRLSFSKLTFPHMLMRVILSEQIYRAFTIIEGKTYHK